MSERRHLRPVTNHVNSCSLVISCDTCALRDSDACHDCVVSFVLERTDAPLRFSTPELRAVELLADAGLVPSLKHRQAG